MTWWFNGKPVKDIVNMECYHGFVYMITNTTNGKKYIGQKQFFSMKSKKHNGKKIKVTIESNWRQYYSSSTELKNDIKLIGKEHFKREILCLCISKNQLNYMEAKYQFLYGVLEDESWYNKWINVKCGFSNIRGQKD